MAEDPLKSKDVATVTQVADGEGMPESMRRAPDTFNTGPPRIFFDNRSQTVSS